MSFLSISFLFIFLQYFFPSISSPTTTHTLAPALYVFGDSVLDSGNNNHLLIIAKANYSPYCSNFVQGITGRFTNGRTMADFIAEFLGLPYSPPYMGIMNNESVPITGLNFGSASCGILPESGSTLGKCLHLDEQIDLFEDTVKSKLPTYFDISQQLSDYLSKSVFVISTGSNDYMCNYLQPRSFNTSKIYAPQPFAQLLIDALSRKLERLYNLGARKIVMFEIGAVGCIPAIKWESVKCVEEKNQLVSYLNDGLLAMLRNLTTCLKGSNFVLGHSHWLGYDAATNPSKYGLMNANNPCCTTWGNGDSKCIPLLKPCPKADKFYFWDGFHPTESVHSLIASACINNASVCIPLTLKDLVTM